MNHVVNEPLECVIKPSDIDASKHFADAFGDSATEDSAQVIVHLCQERGDWGPLSQDELDEHTLRGQFHWRQLLSNGWVIQRADGLFHVTFGFVARCYAAAPSREPLCGIRCANGRQ